MSRFEPSTYLNETIIDPNRSFELSSTIVRKGYFCRRYFYCFDSRHSERTNSISATWQLSASNFAQIRRLLISNQHVSLAKCEILRAFEGDSRTMGK